MVPASELKRTGVQPSAKRPYELANGEIYRYEVGWVELSLMDETIQSRVIFGPDNAEPILGVMALEAVRLVVDTTSQKSFASKLRNHSWTQSVQGAVATWSVISRDIF